MPTISLLANSGAMCNQLQLIAAVAILAPAALALALAAAVPMALMAALARIAAPESGLELATI